MAEEDKKQQADADDPKPGEATLAHGKVEKDDEGPGLGFASLKAFIVIGMALMNFFSRGPSNGNILESVLDFAKGPPEPEAPTLAQAPAPPKPPQAAG